MGNNFYGLDDLIGFCIVVNWMLISEYFILGLRV